MNATVSDIYNQAFYDAGRNGMQKSAHEIVPVLVDMLKPASVIDVGCGEGWWLQEFDNLGVKRLVGIEQNVEHIAAGELVKHDLERPIPLREMNEQFDLCLCLETAEHLPPQRAHGFVRELCHLSDAIIFSAAIPRQGGNHHINEQWASYWAQMFNEFSFEGSDYLRWKFWDNKSIEVWYRQNIILFQRGGTTWSHNQKVYDVVHPTLWGYYRGLNG